LLVVIFLWLHKTLLASELHTHTKKDSLLTTDY
jgi:hypothetical protein